LHIAQNAGSPNLGYMIGINL